MDNHLSDFRFHLSCVVCWWLFSIIYLFLYCGIGSPAVWQSKVSPTWTEQYFQPTWTRFHFFSLVVWTPTFGKANANTVFINRTDNSTGYRCRPYVWIFCRPETILKKKNNVNVSINCWKRTAFVKTIFCIYCTYFTWSKARRQWPGGTRKTSIGLESISLNVGECTKTGADERLYIHIPSDSRLNVTPKRETKSRQFKCINNLFTQKKYEQNNLSLLVAIWICYHSFYNTFTYLIQFFV